MGQTLIKQLDARVKEESDNDLKRRQRGEHVEKLGFYAL
jgi:hypothetical protein